MLPEPPALQFKVIFNSEGPRKIWHTELKRGIEYNKWLTLKNEDRMLKAIRGRFPLKPLMKLEEKYKNVLAAGVPCLCLSSDT